MKRTYTLADIGNLAIDFARLRVESRKRTAERNACACRYEIPADEHGPGGCAEGRNAVCWKPQGADRDGDPVYLPRDKWCPSCIRREELHGEAAALRRRAGLASARLTRALAAPVAGRAP